MPKPSAILGDNLKKYRSALGWSQADLARLLNVTVPSISRIESGKAWVTQETLTKLSEVFQIPIYLFLHSPDQDEQLIEHLLTSRKALDSAVTFVNKNMPKPI